MTDRSSLQLLNHSQKRFDTHPKLECLNIVNFPTILSFTPSRRYDKERHPYYEAVLRRLAAGLFYRGYGPPRPLQTIVFGSTQIPATPIRLDIRYAVFERGELRGSAYSPSDPGFTDAIHKHVDILRREAPDFWLFAGDGARDFDLYQWLGEAQEKWRYDELHYDVWNKWDKRIDAYIAEDE
jgi:hypothetical protein